MGLLFVCFLCFVLFFGKVVLWSTPVPRKSGLHVGLELTVDLISCLFLLNAGITSTWHHAWSINLLVAIYISHSHGDFSGFVLLSISAPALCSAPVSPS